MSEQTDATGLTATPWTDEDAWRDLTDRLAEMTRQRDEAVKAFQRERARVGRVEALASEWARNAGPGSRAADVFGPQKVSVDFAVREIRAALADRSEP